MSATGLTSFPWPLDADTFTYSVNLEPAPAERRTEIGAWGSTVVDIDDEYEDYLATRRRILAADRARYAELPHMREASWDALIYLLGQAAQAQPASMSLRREAGGWLWTNRRLGAEQWFRRGDDSSLPAPPLLFAASQVPDDMVLLDEREDTFFLDAGVVTFAGNWSFDFDLGMSFLEIHGPVPRDYAGGAIPRAESFIKRMQPGACFRRTNWAVSADADLDHSLEAARDRISGQPPLAGDDLMSALHLRVEVQHVIRLAPSNAVLFLIRTYRQPFTELATVEPWWRRLTAVIAGLPADIADYKGATDLQKHWAGSPPTPGR
ncbi:DUF3445 domain-containing protein [Streptosporangiaceae bacterium NEAU-GS5]|nr:DUF3445 domain-containing protein [Streptosporangiaceae bacterium NEAU-GS5]